MKLKDVLKTTKHINEMTLYIREIRKCESRDTNDGACPKKNYCSNCPYFKFATDGPEDFAIKFHDKRIKNMAWVNLKDPHELMQIKKYFDYHVCEIFADETGFSVFIEEKNNWSKKNG